MLLFVIHREKRWHRKGQGRLYAHVLQKLLWRKWNCWSSGIALKFSVCVLFSVLLCFLCLVVSELSHAVELFVKVVTIRLGSTDSQVVGVV